MKPQKSLKKLCSFLWLVHYIGKIILKLAQISLLLHPLLKKTSKFIWTEAHENCGETSAILAFEAPKSLKKLCSFLGSVHYIGKIFLKLAQVSHPLHPLLKKTSKFIWTEAHENCFGEIKNRMTNATQKNHYNPQLETRVKCDASRSGLGAALEQLTVDGWKPIAFTSRFLNPCKEQYSINKLELLGVVWSIEYLKNYLYGKHLTVITDHRALLSILKQNRLNKFYNSRLTR